MKAELEISMIYNTSTISASRNNALLKFDIMHHFLLREMRYYKTMLNISRYLRAKFEMHIANDVLNYTHHHTIAILINSNRKKY